MPATPCRLRLRREQVVSAAAHRAQSELSSAMLTCHSQEGSPKGACATRAACTHEPVPCTHPWLSARLTSTTLPCMQGISLTSSAAKQQRWKAQLDSSWPAIRHQQSMVRTSGSPLWHCRGLAVGGSCVSRLRLGDQHLRQAMPSCISPCIEGASAPYPHTAVCCMLAQTQVRVLSTVRDCAEATAALQLSQISTHAHLGHLSGRVWGQAGWCATASCRRPGLPAGLGSPQPQRTCARPASPSCCCLGAALCWLQAAQISAGALQTAAAAQS